MKQEIKILKSNILFILFEIILKRLLSKNYITLKNND